MDSAADYIDDLQANGRLVFTTDDAVRALGRSVPATRAQLRRLKEKGRIAVPYRGFHLVVPLRHRKLGCLPPEHFIPQLMEHLEEPYYVALLSAAAYHGAALPEPMVFQVMVSQSRRTIQCGSVRVDFVVRRDMRNTSVIERDTSTGVLRVASPAATAVELVGYAERCGFLDNVATVMAEFAGAVEVETLVAEARRSPVAWVQRLGYLLDSSGFDDIAVAAERGLRGRERYLVPLGTDRGATGAPRSVRWNVAVNTGRASRLVKAACLGQSTATKIGEQ